MVMLSLCLFSMYVLAPSMAPQNLPCQYANSYWDLVKFSLSGTGWCYVSARPGGSEQHWIW